MKACASILELVDRRSAAGDGAVDISRDEWAAIKDEIGRMTEILSTPYLDDFAEAVVAEAKHQRFRWGDEDDAKKTAWDWFWALGYLGGKAAHAALAGDRTKARHHTITAAALLANWHRHISKQCEAAR